MTHVDFKETPIFLIETQEDETDCHWHNGNGPQ
jgi:hypothetical protein